MNRPTTNPEIEKPEPPAPRTRERVQTFRALRHRDFRLLWVSLIVSGIGTWMQIVAQSLLVLKITHGSALALGIVSLAQALSFFLFALIGGSVADRIDKRRFLLVTQSLSMLLAFLLGVLTYTGVIQVWMIVVLAFCSGCILSFDQPARAALVPMLVPREDLMNAISLQSIVFNGSAVLGPTLAGITIGLIGYAGNFFLNAVSFLGVLVVLFALRVPHDAAANSSAPGKAPILASIGAALRTVGQDPVLPWVLSGYAALLFFNPSATIILPVFAVQVLHLNAVELGLLFSASGIGTLAGALIVSSLGDVKRKGVLLLGALLLWTGALVLFAISRSLWLSMLALFIFGSTQNAIATTVITLMQTRVPPQMRGRVMSLNSLMVMGVRPLGDFPAGAAIALIGGPLTVLISASIIGAYTLFLLLGRPVIRRLEG
ncbi:MAG: MFS transporter [Chloroflexota bacterium]|nr:MFS transporter [Chloroflexota bacterium]